MPAGEVLRCEGLTKSFSGVEVLRQAGLCASGGRILGLVGENGAGKSTLANIVGGVLKPDSGAMWLQGKPYSPANPLAAQRSGVALVHQELNLFPNLSVTDNLFLTSFPLRRTAGAPWIDRELARHRTRELLEQAGLDVPPDALVETLPQGERQLVEIARALHARALLIIFDEPTTSLTARESERLLARIERLREEGLAVIYISHVLDDVLRLCDEIVVLRDGLVVGAGPRSEFTRDKLITLMVGRTIEQFYPVRADAPRAEVALELRSVSQPGLVENVSLTLRRGEILGLAGLLGSGRSELARIIFGLDDYARGEILLNGKPLPKGCPREAIARGMAFLTESRREDGLFMEQPVSFNLEIVFPEPDRVQELVRSLRLVCANLHSQPVKRLSGGNQQKVALGKWLVRTPAVLILDEPTRGIDVGARHEFYRLIHHLAAEGVALLVISSEIEELMGICDRILAMRRGEIRGCFERGQFDREAILEAAL